ncbi:hypothetical protein I6F35_28055 [Bradyrhizobium sp. BRP22]|uniref:hypothetical protein n=1 Tax=Bradyrhizobium sp. BRP22 TaxID=2793821 RepID=UPI001CD4BCA9|nr:hypothetical protein [Bradyrhizobium sp. BRP22]MCA1457028.1 hypothetical protein [Bradyrhizobium sp. BRP22]
MRKFVIVAAGMALLGYASYRPAAPPAPPAPSTAVAALPRAEEPPPRTATPAPRQESARLARTALPSDIAPKVNQQPVQRPAQAAPPAPAKRTAEVLTAAAIAALIIQESRRAYHATGRPCACPDDSMRNGRACGSRSAYSRPGGRAPLCYPGDITEAMIKNYRARLAER